MRKVFASLFAAAVVATALPTAAAVPPSGPSANTPGTYVSFQGFDPKDPTTGYVLISGFPAGQKFGVKIDNGKGYSDTSIHGHGNVLKRPDKVTVPAGGYGTVEFSVPCGLDVTKPHTIRVLSFDPSTKTKYSAQSNNTFHVSRGYKCTVYKDS